MYVYLTRSARLRACKFLLARLATSSSAMVVALGGCDHLCAEGVGCRAKLADCTKRLVQEKMLELPLQDRNGRVRKFMVALVGRW